MHIRRRSVATIALPLLLSACSGESANTSADGLPQIPVGAAGMTGDDDTSTDGIAPNLPLAPAAANPALTGVEVPGADCPVPTLPEFAELTANPALPNPFLTQSGAPVTTQAQWACRHRELRAMFEKYETGAKTEKPAEVTGSFADGTLAVTVSDGAGKTATFNVTVTYPATGTAPYPAMIGLNGGSLNNARLQEQGVALINFDVNSVRPEGNRDAGAYATYTGLSDSGSLIAWAWGVSRVIDALETTPVANIKTDRLGITGCSRLGKGALMIGAMDSRIALTIPQESGSGGTGAWRASEVENTEAPQGCETPADLTRCVQKLSSTYTETAWFGNSIAPFANAVDRLPVDHHELIAMAAPRGLLALGNIGWRWLGRYSSIQAMSAARAAYEALSVNQNIGFVESGHFHCNSNDFAGREQAAIDAFVSKFLLDQEVGTDFWDADPAVPFDAARWVDWTTPVLQ
jgi:(4-O-methyl)-D-glucuronate---lignin esterase